MANFRVRRGFAPEVKRQFVPRISLSDRAGAIYAGGLRDVASGLKAFSAGLKDYADEQEAEKRREDGFEVQMALIDQENRALTGFQQAKNNAPLGAEGFTENNADAVAESNKALLESLQARGLDERAMRAAHLGLAGIQQSVLQKSITFEQQSRSALFENQAVDATNKIANLALDDPDQIEGYVERFESIIDSLPANVTEFEREELRRQGREHIELIAAEALAKQDPMRVVGAFEEYEGGTVISAMKRAIAGVESAGNRNPYNAIGPTTRNGDRAYGKYQVMGGNVPAWTRDALGKSMTAEEFRNSPEAQEAVFEHRMGRYLEEHNGSIRDAASMWFTGVDYSTAVAQGRDDTFLSVEEYVGKVQRNLAGKGAATGNGESDPVLRRLNAKQRLAILNRAEAEINQQQTDLRADLAIDLKNAYTAYGQGVDYNGEAITRDRFQKAFDSAIADQKWAEYQHMERVGELIGTMKTQSAATIDERLRQMKPTDTSSKTYGVESDTYNAALDARDAVIKERTDDPAAYVMKNFPSVNTQWRAALEEEGQSVFPATVYEGMWKAYDQLGIPNAARIALPDAAAEAVKNSLKTLSPRETINYLMQMRNNMPEDMFYNTLEQLDTEGLPNEAFVAGLVHEAGTVVHSRAAENALRGRKMLDEDKSLQVAHEEFKTGFNAMVPGLTRAGLGSTASTLYDLALGLYVAQGNDPNVYDVTKFEAAVRVLVGGVGDDSDTGIVNLGTGNAQYHTVLPVGRTAQEFTGWIQTADESDYARLGNWPVVDAEGLEITADDIAEDGVFVRVGQNEFRIAMGLDGDWLYSQDGTAFTVKLTPDEILSAQSDLMRDEAESLGFEPPPSPAEGLRRLQRNRVFGDTDLPPPPEERPTPPPPKKKTPRAAPEPIEGLEQPGDVLNRLKQMPWYNN